ncbi:hypothetical protein CISIN_1g022953mg [Citrus sinensis]|uniref:rRNA biogenesis protein RRP36 n=1 Tax=Citrus sinensis TaxID=2711 RepID=A0A067F844_CITSI|nr:hypothetical protein CISIN_1g022953mg [Citrus sinensis]
MKKPNNATAGSSKTKFKEESEEDNKTTSVTSSEEEEEIERELAEITFEDLLKARSDGSHLVYRKNSQEKKAGRANKNRPMEVSAKKPVSRFREVVQAPKRVVRDPRFESLCGNLDVEGFRKRYDFLFENTLPAEKEELKKQLKKTNDPNAVDKLKKRISWIDKQLRFESTKSTDAAILAEHKKKEREAAKHGKRPFYLKNCNRKSASKDSLRNITSSRGLAKLNHSLRKDEGRMLQRITNTCHIVGPIIMTNRTNDFTCFWLRNELYMPHRPIVHMVVRTSPCLVPNIL